MEQLTARQRRILIAQANGLEGPDLWRFMGLTRDQVNYDRLEIYRKLGTEGAGINSMVASVAKAWRLCLIDADEIVGGPVILEPGEEWPIRTMLKTYRERSRYLPPPPESWEELQERAARIADEYRLQGFAPGRKAPQYDAGRRKLPA